MMAIDLDKTEHRSGKTNARHTTNGATNKESTVAHDGIGNGAAGEVAIAIADNDDDGEADDGNDARVPRVISFSNLAEIDVDNENENDPVSNNARKISHARGVNRRTSDLTLDADAGGLDGNENENDSLLNKRERQSYGGTTTANGNINDGGETMNNHGLLKKTSSSSILKQPFNYSSSTSQLTPGAAAVALASDDDDDDSNDIPPASPVSSARVPNSKVRDMRTSWLRSSISSHVSQMSVFSSSFRQRTINETTILAPDDLDLDLPPQTPLLGSSRFAANAFRDDLRMRDSESKRNDEGGSHRGSHASGSRRGISWEHTRDAACCNSTLGSHSHGGSTARTLREIEADYLEKARTTFVNDAMTFAEGTIPQSIVLAFCIGCVCGVVSFVYYTVLDYFLDLIWKDMPERFVVNVWPEKYYVLWIPLATITLSILCGLSVVYLGEPGDLAYTIKCVHEKGYKGTSHIIPMVASSLFSILAGASLGPEAPLVAICAATAGFLSRKVFKQKNRNVVRKHTFMGMAGALSAFFGVPLGGSLFALEVTSRFGIEYFEHLVEAIFAGEICVVVFRTLAGLPLGAIWKISPTKLEQTEPYMIVQGAIIGLMGASLAFIWANFHWRLMDAFRFLSLLDDENANAVPRVLLGALGVVIIGMLVPHTMFWGEWEIGPIATLSPASDLPHVWPTSGLIGFEMDTCLNCIIVGSCKLVAISFTVAGGYRGGYIFPFFAAGAAFGRALCFVWPSLNPSIATLCFAAGINVAITRTSLATPLILASLSGEQFSLAAVLAASVVSLFATGYVPFIKSQLARSDIDFSLYYRKNRHPKIQDSFRGAKPLSLDISNYDE